jgi:large repetitive protein
VIAGDQTAPSIVGLVGGRFAISWTASQIFSDSSGTALSVQLFNADGSRFNGEIGVNTTTFNDQRLPALAALSGGGFVDVFDSGLVGNDFSNVDTRARLFDSTGTSVINGVTGTPADFMVNTTTPSFQSNPDVATMATR